MNITAVIALIKKLKKKQSDCYIFLENQSPEYKTQFLQQILKIYNYTFQPNTVQYDVFMFEQSTIDLIKMIFEYGVRYCDIKVKNAALLPKDLDIYISTIKNKHPLNVAILTGNERALIYLLQNHYIINLKDMFDLYAHSQITITIRYIFVDYFQTWNEYSDHLYPEIYRKVGRLMLLINERFDNIDQPIPPLPKDLTYIIMYFCDRLDFNDDLKHYTIL